MDLIGSENAGCAICSRPYGCEACKSCEHYEEVDGKTGLLPLEKMCHDSLMVAYAVFLKMERQHPDELRDFVDPLRRLQDLLSIRIVRRAYPEGGPHTKARTLKALHPTPNLGDGRPTDTSR